MDRAPREIEARNARARRRPLEGSQSSRERRGRTALRPSPGRDGETPAALWSSMAPGSISMSSPAAPKAPHDLVRTCLESPALWGGWCRPDAGALTHHEEPVRRRRPSGCGPCRRDPVRKHKLSDPPQGPAFQDRLEFAPIVAGEEHVVAQQRKAPGVRRDRQRDCWTANVAARCRRAWAALASSAEQPGAQCRRVAVNSTVLGGNLAASRRADAGDPAIAGEDALDAFPEYEPRAFPARQRGQSLGQGRHPVRGQPYALLLGGRAPASAGRVPRRARSRNRWRSARTAAAVAGRGNSRPEPATGWKEAADARQRRAVRRLLFFATSLPMPGSASCMKERSSVRNTSALRAWKRRKAVSLRRAGQVADGALPFALGRRRDRASTRPAIRAGQESRPASAAHDRQAAPRPSRRWRRKIGFMVITVGPESMSSPPAFMVRTLPAGTGFLFHHRHVAAGVGEQKGLPRGHPCPHRITTTRCAPCGAPCQHFRLLPFPIV